MQKYTHLTEQENIHSYLMLKQLLALMFVKDWAMRSVGFYGTYLSIYY